MATFKETYLRNLTLSKILLASLAKGFLKTQEHLSKIGEFYSKCKQTSQIGFPLGRSSLQFILEEKVSLLNLTIHHRLSA